MLSDVDVLVFGENEYDFHRIAEKGPRFESALADAGATVTVTTDLNELGPDRIGAYDAVVDYLTTPSFTRGQRKGLFEFVRNGGGYVGIHGAADVKTFVDEPDEELSSLIGGSFIDHPETSEFSVRIATEHPATAGLDDFDVFDEPYNLRWKDNVTVLAQMAHPDLEGTPVAWTRTEGEGRVFYCSLGHTDEAVETPAFQQLLVQGTGWTVGSDA